MKNLTTMFTIAAFAMTLGAAGCKKKVVVEGTGSDGSAAGSAAMAAGSAAMTAGSAAMAVGSAAMAAGSAAAAGGGGDLPAECNDYKAAMDKLMACDKAKAAAAPMKDAFDKTWAAFQATPAAGRGALGASCKAAADGVNTTLTSMGC